MSRTSPLLRLAAALSALAAGSASSTPVEEAAPTSVGSGALSAAELVTLERLSSPRLSPDGRRVAFVSRRTDWAANRGVFALRVLEVAQAGGPPVTLADGESGDVEPRWSIDGAWIYYLSSRSGSTQVWRVATDGSRRQQVTALPADLVGFRPAPDGTSLYVAARAHLDCDHIECTRRKDEAADATIGRSVLVTAGPARYRDSYGASKGVALFRVAIGAVPVAGGERRVAPGFGADIGVGDGDLSIAPDGRTLYFAALEPGSERGGDGYRRLYAAAADGSGPARPMAGGDGRWVAELALSGDGRSLALLETAGSMWTFGRTALVLIDLASGRRRELAPDDDLLLTQIAWSGDDRRLIATADVTGRGELYEIDVSTGRKTGLLAAGTAREVSTGPRSFVYLQDGFRSVAQVMLREGSAAPRRLTSVGAARLAAAGLSAPEQFSFAGWNGELVHGYVLKPRGYVEGRRYPVVLLIHGGPQDSFADRWSYRWNPQIWSSWGYAVVLIDFHGSTGYGSAFGSSSIGHWGDRPLEDLQKGWASVLASHPYIDGSRACALGASYGGYMIDWIASRWNAPWRCLVSHAGIFDLRFLRRSMGLSAFVDAQLGPDAEAAIARFDPAPHAREWRVPMLFTHGLTDYLVPPDQGASAYNAARANGVATELLLFPGEGHQLLRPQNVVRWYQVVRAWLDRWNPVSTASGGSGG